MSGVEQHGRRATATSHSGWSRKRKQRNLQQAPGALGWGFRSIKIVSLCAKQRANTLGALLLLPCFPVKFLGGPGVDTLAAAVAGQRQANSRMARPHVHNSSQGCR
jgi:hypothetical protein